MSSPAYTFSTPLRPVSEHSHPHNNNVESYNSHHKQMGMTRREMWEQGLGMRPGILIMLHDALLSPSLYAP